jgi:radical SAM superfamily enzyme YgiQ (UPF0313 family)
MVTAELTTTQPRSIKVALAIPEMVLNSASPPMGVAILAACLRKAFPFAVIQIFDGAVEREVLQRILQFQPDLLGVSAMTIQAMSAYKLLDDVKSSQPGIITAIGGVHASAFPEEAGKHADVVIVGEGEETLVDVVNRLLSNRSIPHIINGEAVADLDSLPFPAFDLLHMQKYLSDKGYVPALSRFNRFPLIRVITSRGCAWRCPFCTNSTRAVPVRYHSAGYIIRLLQLLIQKYGVKSVWFYDDEFLANRKRLMELVEKLESSGLTKQLIWACQARATSITQEVATAIKSAGCVCVFFGIESAAPRILKYLKCGTVTIQNVESAISICHNAGIAVFGSFIFGSPTESLQEMKETWDWILRHRHEGLTDFGFGILTPYPDTEIYNYALDHNIFSSATVDYSRLGPTRNPYEAYLVDEAISAKEFATFLVTCSRFSWLINQFQRRNIQVVFSRTFLWALFKHPHELSKIWNRL